LKPLGAIVSSLDLECWLCDLFVAGVVFERVNDTDITISEREYTKLCLFYPHPSITLSVVSSDVVQ
jgi:hypothetical protein